MARDIGHGARPRKGCAQARGGRGSAGDAALQFAQDAFALHLAPEGVDSLFDIVVTNQNLQRWSLHAIAAPLRSSQGRMTT